MCSLVCPHGAIRPFLLNEKEVIDAPEVVSENLIDALKIDGEIYEVAEKISALNSK